MPPLPLPKNGRESPTGFVGPTVLKDIPLFDSAGKRDRMVSRVSLPYTVGTYDDDDDNSRIAARLSHIGGR